MSKLWIFGDSYGHFNKDHYEYRKDDHWIPIVANSIADESFTVLAHHGAPNEWIFYQFRNHLDKINEGDYVILISTQIDRKWFFEDNVGAGNLNVVNDTQNRLTVEQKYAVKQYILHLRNPKVNPINFEMFCFAAHYIALAKRINLLILPGFEEEGFPISGQYAVRGSLFDVCKNEIKGKSLDTWKYWIGVKHYGDDPRLGHLSEVNHIVLADKIINTFKNNELLDLTTGFHEEIL